MQLVEISQALSMQSRILLDVLIKELDKQKIVTHMIGRDEDVGDIGKRKDKLGSTKLELKDISTVRGHHRINLQVKEGEVLGLYGLVGAGRSELAKAIMGAERITSGEIRIDGKPARIKNVQDALKNWHIGYVSENRKEEGLILAHSVILISSDMPEMVLLADRVVVMKDMRIVGDLPNSRQYEGMSSQIMHCIHASVRDVNIENGVLAPQGA
jgi:ABC-type sugar transport system ATPase subunit